MNDLSPGFGVSLPLYNYIYYVCVYLCILHLYLIILCFCVFLSLFV